MAITKAQLGQIGRVGNFTIGKINQALTRWVKEGPLEDPEADAALKEWSAAWKDATGQWKMLGGQAQKAVQSKLDLTPYYAAFVAGLGAVHELYTGLLELSGDKATADLSGLAPTFPQGIEIGVYKDSIAAFPPLAKSPRVLQKPASAFAGEPGQKKDDSWMKYIYGAAGGALLTWVSLKR